MGGWIEMGRKDKKNGSLEPEGYDDMRCIFLCLYFLCVQDDDVAECLGFDVDGGGWDLLIGGVR
jgi:hypothetical protein